MDIASKTVASVVEGATGGYELIPSHTSSAMGSMMSGNNDTIESTQLLIVPSQSIPHIIFVVVMALMCTLGTFGNILIMISVALDKKLQVLGNVFIVNLAIADLLVTAVTMTFIVVGLFNDAEFFDTFPEMCVFMGVLVVISCACSIWSIAAISVERYIHICHVARYPRLFNRRTVPLLVISLWLIALVVTLPYFDFHNSLGTDGYRDGARQCTWNYKGSYFRSYFLIGLGIVVPMIIIPCCYVSIFFFVKKSTTRLSMHRRNTPGINRKNTDLTIVKTVGAIWVTFVLMWTPYTANILFNFYDTWPDWFVTTGTALGVSNSSINVIIYGIMNKNFRRSYSVVYHKLSCVKAAGKRLRKFAEVPQKNADNNHECTNM